MGRTPTPRMAVGDGLLPHLGTARSSRGGAGRGHLPPARNGAPHTLAGRAARLSALRLQTSLRRCRSPA